METGEGMMGYQFRTFLERECKVGEWGRNDYSWDLVAVYRHPGTGRLFMASGSGCSCDSLLSDVSRWGDLQPLTDLKVFRAALDDVTEGPQGAAKMVAVSRVAEALRGVGA